MSDVLAPIRESKNMRLAVDIIAHIEAEQRPRETYSDTLRRLLGLDREDAQGRAEPRERRAPEAP